MTTCAPQQHQSPQRASSTVARPRNALAVGRQPHPFHQLQRSIGNQAVLRLQAKLAIGPPADAFEQEADRVADHVMRTPAQQLQRACACANTCSNCQTKHLQMARAKDSSEREADRTADQAPDNLLQELGSSQPLDPDTRAFFEPRFGHDFSHIRIHADGQAGQAAQSVSARAFTVGSDIVFGHRQYAPDTSTGRTLLAHELTHTIQQDGRRQVIARDEEPDAPILPSGKTVKFVDLKDGDLVADPTGRKHGIRIQRSGDDLYYHLKNGSKRQVPRPKDAGKRDTIKEIWWAQGQNVFTVEYSHSLEPFSLNVFGLGRFQTLEDAFLQKAASLEVLPGGLEEERSPGVLGPDRPARLKDAIRYRVPGGSYSLYAGKDTAEIVEESSGKTARKYTKVVDLRIRPSGDVELTWNDSTGVMSVSFTLTGSALGTPTGAAAGASARRTKLLADVNGLGIKIEETGAQFTEDELDAAMTVLNGWKGAKSVVDSLKALKVPGLTLRKGLLITAASYSPDKGSVNIPGGVVDSVDAQRLVVIHEVSHALFHAAGLSVPAKVPADVRAEAKELYDLSDVDLIKEGSIESRKKLKAAKDWEPLLSTDKEMNEIWRELHYRFKIGDPEGTGDIRGFDVVDESRYSADPRGEPVGHGFDNLTEFIASFVTSCLNFGTKVVATVRTSGSAELARLYLRLWDRVNSTLVTLGTVNPFKAVADALAKAAPKTSP